jgi:hypothetical protein
LAKAFLLNAICFCCSIACLLTYLFHICTHLYFCVYACVLIAGVSSMVKVLLRSTLKAHNVIERFNLKYKKKRTRQNKAK